MITMQRGSSSSGSSSSVSLSEKTKNCPGHPTLFPSPPKVFRPRRKGTDWIDDPKKREITFSKRSNGFMKKASDLCSLTDAIIVLIMFFEGEFCFFGGLSNEGEISKLLLPTSPKEAVDWAKKERDSCVTKEECNSLIMIYLKVVVRLLEKLKEFENSSTMQTGSSSSSSLFEKTKKLRKAMHTGPSSSDSGKTKKRPGPSNLSSSTPKMALTRRKGSDKIDDPKKCSVTFSKRSDGLENKANALNSLTGALVAVAVLSSKGEFHSFSKVLVKEGDPNLQTIPKEWPDWAEELCVSCRTKEDCASLIMKCRVLLNYLCKKLEDLQVKDSAGDDSLEKNFETPHLSFVAGVNHDSLFTSPVDSAATSSESSGMDYFGQLLDDLNEFVCDPDIQLFLLEDSSRSDRESCEINTYHVIFDGLPSLLYP